MKLARIKAKQITFFSRLFLKRRHFLCLQLLLTSCFRLPPCVLVCDGLCCLPLILSSSSDSLFFQLKRNVSTVCSWIKELHSFIGYKVPIVTYCSQGRLPIKTNFVKFEKFQIMAIKGILSSLTSQVVRTSASPLG